jgi:hypothetical protein
MELTSRRQRCLPVLTRMLAGLVLATGCGSAAIRSGERGAAPAMLLGTFVDDYGNRFRISDSLFEQQPHGRFHIVEWNVAAQYFIARNDEANPAAPGRWTRLDWMVLADMPPWTWAFCMTAHDAPTRTAAVATPAANRGTPRSGCGGYPFSRMARATN